MVLEQECFFPLIESPASVGFSLANGTGDLLHSDLSQSEDAFTGLQ